MESSLLRVGACQYPSVYSCWGYGQQLRQAFTMELMNAIRFLARECQTSLHDFANLLRSIGKQQPQVCNHQYLWI